MLETRQILTAGDEAAVFAGCHSAAAALGQAGPARWQVRVKMTVDRMLAFAGLVILSPVLLFCGLTIIAASPGPVLFTQVRVGLKGRLFRIYKFRTMSSDDGAASCDEARIFPAGALMRWLSLDELPQLFNVLRGEMSLVGPRPHMAGQLVEGDLFEDAVYHYGLRHQVMPGMTGWAQINGCRGPAVTRAQLARRVEHDLFYVENWNLKLDFIILFRTVCFGFIGRPAF
jgi:putative colanic acid biosynthesis UDP-glucose lipid carrier transferase